MRMKRVLSMLPRRIGVLLDLLLALLDRPFLRLGVVLSAISLGTLFVPFLFRSSQNQVTTLYPQSAQ